MLPGLTQGLLLVLAVLATLLPFIWMGVSSFRDPGEIFRNAMRLNWHSFVPERLSLVNWEGVMRPDFLRPLANSIFVTVATVIPGVLINSAAGFAFAVFRFPGRDMLFAAVLLSFMVPFESIVIPLFSLVRWLGWVDTYPVLIVPEIANGLVIFLFRQFFTKLGRELFEAALIDGATWGRIFWSIALPLSWPTVASAGLILFLTQWDAFFWPLVAASSPEYTLVQVAITRNLDFEQTNYGRLFSAMTAASVVAVIPFLLLQRFYIRSITTSGMK